MSTTNAPFQEHGRIIILLVLIFIADIFWFILCVIVFKSMLLLLTFEVREARDKHFSDNNLYAEYDLLITVCNTFLGHSTDFG